MKAKFQTTMIKNVSFSRICRRHRPDTRSFTETCEGQSSCLPINPLLSFYAKPMLRETLKKVTTFDSKANHSKIQQVNKCVWYTWQKEAPCTPQACIQTPSHGQDSQLKQQKGRAHRLKQRLNILKQRTHLDFTFALPRPCFLPTC